jgi:hypothetical protein
MAPVSTSLLANIDEAFTCYPEEEILREVEEEQQKSMVFFTILFMCMGLSHMYSYVFLPYSTNNVLLVR